MLAVVPLICTSSSLSPSRLTVWLERAETPTAPQLAHRRSTARASSTLIRLRLSASRNSSWLVMMPNWVTTKTSGESEKSCSVTKSFRPVTIDTTAITVITPMITPRSVRKLRSLLVRRAMTAILRVSMALGTGTGSSARRST